MQSTVLYVFQCKNLIEVAAIIIHPPHPETIFFIYFHFDGHHTIKIHDDAFEKRKIFRNGKEGEMGNGVWMMILWLLIWNKKNQLTCHHTSLVLFLVWLWVNLI